jgi:acylpyruvate hydrolase
VVRDERVHPLLGFASLRESLVTGALRERPAVESVSFSIETVEWLPVIPNPARVICLGLNYRAHVDETGRELPSYPVLFTKFGSSLIGAEAPIVKPEESHQLDFEAELAVVIGHRIRRASTTEALGAVAGYTMANDITMRDYQYKSHQWLQGKAWDHSTPLGPNLVTPDEVGDPNALEITLRLNGETMQQSNTNLLIFDIAQIIQHISEFTELEPGDVILTGTPGGVGYRREPQVFLEAGNLVEVEIERLGVLRNRVIAEG